LGEPEETSYPPFQELDLLYAQPVHVFVRTWLPCQMSFMTDDVTSVFGIYYLMFTIFGEFFTKTYGFSLGIGGLTYLGLGVGFCFSTIFNAKFADKIYHHVRSIFHLLLSCMVDFYYPKARKKERWCWEAGDADTRTFYWVAFYTGRRLVSGLIER
jgi:hypothetical protein